MTGVHIDEFTVSKSNLNDFRWDIVAKQRSLRDGEVELSPLRFGFTSNNISYARNGSRMRYWEFFPAEDVARGIIPVWGVAEVTASASESLGEGERVYGLLPVRKRFFAQVESSRDGTVIDRSPHRPDHVPIYNTYRRISAHPVLESDSGMLFSPLFGTAFLLSDHLMRERLWNAGALFIMSASSKTGLSTAYLLKRRTSNALILGISGRANHPWLARLDVYDRVYDYDDIASIGYSGRCVLLDFSGNRLAVEAFIDRLGHKLAYGCRLGTTDWRTSMSVAEAKRIGLSTFFAPDHLAAAIAQWGRKGYLAEQARALDEFLHDAKRWMSIRRFHGRPGMDECYAAVLQNRLPGNESAIVSLGSDLLIANPPGDSRSGDRSHNSSPRQLIS